ncbi:MAG: alpha/beta fold hydrolase [Holophagales bacterium]|nr:alpha/beta fold hydrolase [Holophagales bacterium]
MPGPDSVERPVRSRRNRWFRRAVVIYLLLLLASHGVRLLRGRFEPPVPAPGRAILAVGEVESTESGTVPTGRQIVVAYRQWGEHPGEDPGKTARDSAPVGEGPPPPEVLLLHGSPGSGGNFEGLGPLLAEGGIRSVAPDLPGFGESTQQVADYSIRAHARYGLELLDHLGIERAHLVGFSLGGGVALEMWREEPDRVASITLLSSIGVQELELLGQYGLNHAIHGLQLAFFQLIQEGLPHFGLLDVTHVHLSYARNFFDTDQRPLRGLLERYPGPMLILHGEGDVLVPFAAALEHHRIVPQSELVTFEANHFMVFRAPERLARPLVDFVRRAEAGQGAVRAEASAERRVRAEDGEPIQLPRASGPTLLVWCLLLALATFVSEDLTCIAAGLLVARGSLGLTPAVVACALGIFVGDFGLYLAGRFGRPFLDRAPLRWLMRPGDLKRSEIWFERRGPLVILLSRFLPGTRIPTYVSAGLLGMHPVRFGIYLLVPVALWTPLLVGLSYLLGERFLGAFESFQARALPVFVGLLLLVWLLLALGRSLLTWRGRRRLIGAWRRWTRWEFWPPWLFYPPVVLYLLGLAVRYRSATLFTAANPSIPAGGGFLGESKSTILERIRSGRVAPWERLPEGPLADRLEAVGRFVAGGGGEGASGRGYPVVLKPDVGQRGSGVAVVGDEVGAEAFLRSHGGPAIVQEYVGGVELGIFWIRLPGERRGKVFSVTDKQLPEVVGDGTSTLEELVLRDERAVILAETYLDSHAEGRDRVPERGERVRLVDLGTHCRGAVFLDGSQHLTPELEAAVEEIALTFEGFCFGRFDFRAPSYDHFRRGEGLRVLELNGVTSEATHIYDPRNRLRDAYRILFEQWRLAFEIGDRQRRAGHRPIGLFGLLRLLLAYRRRR